MRVFQEEGNPKLSQTSLSLLLFGRYQCRESKFFSFLYHAISITAVSPTIYNTFLFRMLLPLKMDLPELEIQSAEASKM